MGGGLSESVKKETFVMKIFFSDNVEWSSENLWIMISADVKANKNNKKWNTVWKVSKYGVISGSYFISGQYLSIFSPIQENTDQNLDTFHAVKDLVTVSYNFL